MIITLSIKFLYTPCGVILSLRRIYVSRAQRVRFVCIALIMNYLAPSLRSGCLDSSRSSE